MIQVTDQRYLDQINEPFRGSFSAEVKLFFKGGTRTFTDDDIFTISENETANIVADENPTQSTEITLSNYNHEFDINGTSGYFRDISDGIECQYRFGFHVIDEDGSDDIVWLDWKRRWCSGEASLAERQVTFTVADVFSTNDDDIEGYMSSNYGLVVTNVFNKSTYPQQENGVIGVDFDVDLTNTVMYYQPTYTSFNEIIQSVAFASGKQFYIDHKGVVHIDDDRTTPTGVHLGIGDYFEDNEAGKEKKVKKITVSYYVPEDSTVDPRPDFVRAMNGTGESVTVSNDFICSLEDGNRVMSYLVNYYEKRGTFECTFRGDPRLEPLDVITIDILNSDETVQTVTGTIISVENTYDGTFESTIECRYVTTDTTDDTASITGAENFVYPLDSNTPTPASVTLTCTTSINNPTKYVWEYYNMVTSAWTQIGTSSTLTIPYNTEWLSDDVTTTFRCTVNDSVSASVGIKRIYTHATYTYLGIQQTAPSNPTTGDYYLAPSGLVYLWNGQAWVTTTRSDLLINAVADGKTLTGIESTPLGQLIASMQGADGQPGADGKPGADGQPGTDGVSITGVTSYYLATSQSSGVTTETAGWTDTIQTMTETNRYLWTYQVTSFSDGHTETSTPYITGVYGDKGDPGEGGTPSMVTLVPSAVTYELSSRNVIQKQQVITVEARISGGTGTPTWTITPTEADGYTTGKDTNTITITLPVGSSLTGFSVSANVTGIGEDVIYINGTPVGEPTIRFFEQRASAPTTSDNNGEPFITGDYYVTNDGVPMMYEEISNSWRQPNNGDKYYDQIMTNVGNWWLSKGNDITTTTAALYGYFRTIYSNNAIIDQLSVAGIRLQEGGIIQSTVTLPDGTVRGYQPGDGETYGTTGFYLSADGTAEFYNMSAFGIFAKGSFQADAMVTGEGTSAITQSNLYSQYQSDWVSQESYQLITNTSSYTIGDVYSMNISPDDTYAFWTSVSFSASYKNVYAYAMGIGDTVTSATRLTGIENAIEALSSTNYESVSRSVAVRRNGNGYQAVVVGGVSSNYTQRITVIDTTSASATATTHEYTKTNNPVQFGTIPIFTDTQLLLYNAGSGVDLSSFGNYAEYQIGIADLQSDGGSYSFSWGTSSAQSGNALWGKGTEFEIADIQNNPSTGGVYDAVNGRVWIWLVGNGKMFPTEFKSTNWRQGARFRQNDYTLDGTTPIEDDFNEIKTSTYNDYIATDNGMTVITYGNNTAWEIITIGTNNRWAMRSIDFGSTRYGFMGWDGTYIYGKNLSTNRMYRGTASEWSNKNPTSLGYTITSNIVGKYLVDGDILSWSSNVKRTTHGQRMDNIISFFSQLLPKINPSTMSHMPESEPLASVTACTGNVRIAGVNKTIVRMGCSSSTLTIDTNNGSYVYKSGVLYDDTETVEITSLTISAKAASINTKTILPQDNNSYDIGSSGKIYRTIYCTTLFANQLGSGSDKVYRIYADYIGEQSNKTTTIYTTNLYLGSYSRGTTGYTPLPNGLLLQWGIQNRTGTGTGGAWVSVSFPRSFGTVYGVVVNRVCNSNTYADSYVGYLNKPATNSGFTYRKRPVDTMYWLAIGSS